MPRRVLFLAWAPFFSGAERALLLTVQHLDQGRYVPYVITGTDGATVAALRKARIECEVLPLEPLERRRPWRGLRSVLGVLQTARRVGASVIHANDAPSFQPGGYAARILGVPAVTHVRFPDRRAGFSWFLRPGFARALFVSEALRSEALAEAPALFDGRSDVLHDGVILPEPVSAEARLALRRSLELPEGIPVVALTGQVSEVKGIWDFVEAARLLVAQGAAATFVVLGDDLKSRGALRLAMEARVADLGLTSKFRFLGFRNDAPRLIAAFDVVAVPSHIEPLGNATLEAMAAGVPVVGSRVGGIPEMVQDGVTGRLVPPNDPTALASALEILVTNPGIREEFGRAARARAEGEFSLSRHASALQGIYDSILVTAHGGGLT